MTSRFLLVVAAFTAAAATSCASGPPPRAADPPPRAAAHSPAATPTSQASQASLASQAGMPATCRAGDLGARYQAGGMVTGMDVGTIEIWNHGTASCRLAGTVTFTAFFADGTTDRNARLSRPLTLPNTTLPARMAQPHQGADPSAYLTAPLTGLERDDPAQPDGLCRPQDKLTPATLELSIGHVTLRIRNLDPASGNGPTSQAVYGCHGAVLLQQLTGSTTP